MFKTYRFRLYPTRIQAEALAQQLREACTLYNAALQERRDAWRLAKKPISYYDQAAQLKEIRAEGLTRLANYGCCQDVLRRLDKAFAAFFRRLKNGEKAGYPRFKAHQRFDCITFPTYGDGIKLLEAGKLRVQGVGVIKLKQHRLLDGKLKSVSLKREAGKWYACFNLSVNPSPLPPSDSAVGIDVGIENFAVLSTGEVIGNPRRFERAQAKLRRAQRKVARRMKGSRGRRKAINELQSIHAHVKNQRADFQHKVASELVKRHGLIAVERLNFKGMARGMLAKSVHDAAWSRFFFKLAYKAESAGRVLVQVDSRGTSQRCSRCGETVPKTLNQRWHHCASCGLSVSRDFNSALEIIRLGRSLAGSTWDASPCVPAEAMGLAVVESSP